MWETLQDSGEEKVLLGGARQGGIALSHEKRRDESEARALPSCQNYAHHEIDRYVRSNNTRVSNTHGANLYALYYSEVLFWMSSPEVLVDCISVEFERFILKWSPEVRVVW